MHARSDLHLGDSPAIAVVPAAAAGGSSEQPSYRTAAATAFAAFLLYLATLAPTIGLWDAGEYVAAAARMGIPHPPGNPGFVLLGRVVSMMPIATTVATRLNVLVAFASALSCGLWFLVTEHIARHWLSASRARIVAIAAAVLGATAFTVWNQSVVNEKVYTLSLFLLVLDFWTILRWQVQPDGQQADRRLALICYRLGLGYTIHIAGLLAGPAVLAAVLTTRPRTVQRPRFMILCAALFALGFTPFAALPIRAAFRLEINEGHPTACEDGVPALGCTVSRETLNRFLYAHNRTQYAKPPLTDRQQTITNQVKMWWLYYKWQWFRDPAKNLPELQSALGMLMLLLAALGGYAHARHDRTTFIPFAALIATLTIGLIYYLNFKLGFTQAVAMEVTDPNAQEVRDRDYFYLWSYSALSVWIGCGLGYAWRRVAEFFADERGTAREIVLPAPSARHWMLASVVLVVAAVPLVLNFRAASRRGETFAEDYAIDLLNSVEPNAVLFTGGDNDSFPVWFAQQVLGVRRDVSVVLIPYLSTDWYVRELIARTTEPYNVATGPRLYHDMAGSRPKKPLISLTRQAADSVPFFSETFEARRVQMPGFTIVIPPAQIMRDVLMTLRIIHDAGDERPIYFSNGVGSQAITQLLKPYLLTQGLARKLVPDVKAIAGTMVTSDLGPLDVTRTQELWNNYRGRSAMQHHGMWIDDASANSPYGYLRLGLALSEALTLAGSRNTASAVQTEVSALSAAMVFSRYTVSSRAMVSAPAGLGYAPVSGQ